MIGIGLQSQSQCRARNRLALKRLAIVHGRLINPPASAVSGGQDHTSKSLITIGREMLVAVFKINSVQRRT
jgi:hypothetical protein